MSATMKTTAGRSERFLQSSVDGILARANIVPNLAPSTDGEAIPDGIIGATILGFGTIAWDELYDHGSPIALGGLVIDYAPRDGSPARRVSLGFSELGMWIGYAGELESSRMPGPTEDGGQQ